VLVIESDKSKTRFGRRRDLGYVNMHLHPPRRSVSTGGRFVSNLSILDSNRDLEVYRDVSHLEAVGADAQKLAAANQSVRRTFVN
jgi:hypothetical protein